MLSGWTRARLFDNPAFLTTQRRLCQMNPSTWHPARITPKSPPSSIYTPDRWNIGALGADDLSQAGNPSKSAKMPRGSLVVQTNRRGRVSLWLCDAKWLMSRSKTSTSRLTASGGFMALRDAGNETARRLVEHGKHSPSNGHGIDQVKAVRRVFPGLLVQHRLFVTEKQNSFRTPGLEPGVRF